MRKATIYYPVLRNHHSMSATLRGSHRDTPRFAIAPIRALTGIRIIAAVWVLVGHFEKPLFLLIPSNSPTRDIVHSGYLGVEIFFVLSGFIISYNYAEKFKEFTWAAYRHFLVLRFARLYPVHLVTLLMAAVLVVGATAKGMSLNLTGQYNPLTFVMNLSLLQAIPPATSWNGTAWSITAEMGAYITFPLLIILVMKVRSRFDLIFMIASSLCIPIVGSQILILHEPFSATNLPTICMRISGEFTAGCFLWAYWSHPSQNDHRGDWLTLVGAAGVLAIVVVTPKQGPLDFLTLPFITIFILGCATATGPVARILGSRLMDYGGRISYSLYMWHFLVLMIVGKLLPWEWFVGHDLWLRISTVAFYYLSSVLGAMALYHFVEEPGRHLIIGWYRRKSSPPNKVQKRTIDLESASHIGPHTVVTDADRASNESSFNPVTAATPNDSLSAGPARRLE